MPWWGWAVVAAVLALAEMQVPGSYLIWIALGAAVTAAVTALHTAASTELQVAIFAVAAAVCCFAGYFVYRRGNRPAPETALNERGLSLVGARGVVAAPIVNGEGKVRLGDTVWIAEGPRLEVGAPVVVSAVRGTRLVVSAAAEAAIERAG